MKGWEAQLQSSQELELKLPAMVVRAEPITTIEVPFWRKPLPERQEHTWRPDLWSWTVWVPLLAAPGLLVGSILVALLYFPSKLL